MLTVTEPGGLFADILAGMFSTVDINQSTMTITNDELTFRQEGVSRCRRHTRGGLFYCRCTLVSDDNYRQHGLAFERMTLFHLLSPGRLLFA